MAGTWEATACVCGATDATALFDVATPRAPGNHTRIVRCATCGLRRLAPRPDAVRAFYGDQYYSYVGRRRSRRKQALWEFLRDVAAGVRLRGSGGMARTIRRGAARLFDVNVDMGNPSVRRVIDIGCGYGDLLLYLRSRGCSVIGVEYDEAAAAKGQEYGLEIHVGDVSDLGLPESSIDAAVLQHSLEHVPDPDALIAEVGRILRPGGTLHIAVPNGDAAGLAGEREAWGSLSNPQHFWYFDLVTLTSLLERHGFVVQNSTYRMIWRDHVRLFRAERGSAGTWAATRRAARFLAALGRNRGRGGDILRAVFVRV